MDLSGDSVAEFLGEGELQVQFATQGASTEEVNGDSRVSRVVSSSTPMKSLKGGRHEPLSLGVTPVATPVKRAPNVVFAMEEPDVYPPARFQPAKFSRPDLGRNL